MLEEKFILCTFKIQGALYHQIGGLMPRDNDKQKFAQIYFYDTNLDKQFKGT